MDSNSPLFDRIRIKSKAEAKKPTTQPCQHKGCAAAGTHKAPKGRSFEGEYYFFCLPHVQEYNKSYNYFKDMDDGAIADHQKDALTGHRPTWSLGMNGKMPKPEPGDFVADPFGMLRARAAARRGKTTEQRRVVSALARKAFAELDLDETAEPAEVRTRFKQLAKRFHPDLNGGDRSREDKLKAIIEAYNTLKSAGLA